MVTMNNQTKEFDAVQLMRSIRTILNEYIINMSFNEQKEFINRLKTDKDFVKEIIDKHPLSMV